MEGQRPDNRTRGSASAQVLKAAVGQEAWHFSFSLQAALEDIHRHNGTQILKFPAVRMGPGGFSRSQIYFF